MAAEARAPCGDCNNNNNNNNNNNVILISIKTITHENLTVTKRLIKKYCTYIISMKFAFVFNKTILILQFTIESVVPLPFSHVLNNR
jgi:hypothetical protein